MRSPGITVCVINHNGERYLCETLASLRGEDYDEILLMDSASTDGSVSLVTDRFPDVRIVRLETNHGPGPARNAGLAAARTERVLFIDNDVAPDERCAALLAEALDTHPDVVIAVPAVLHAASETIVQYDGAGAHCMGLMSLDHTETPVDRLAPEPRAIGSLSSACLLFDRSRWPGGPVFSDDFFLYLEDHDLGLRTRQMGGGILAVPEARCRHREGTVGVSIRETGGYSSVRVVLTIRNRWQVILRNYQARTIVLLAPALIAFEVVQCAGALAKGWGGHWLRAAAWMAGNAGQVLRARRVIRRRRRLGDRLLLHGGPIPFRDDMTAGPVARATRAALDGVVRANWGLVHRVLSSRRGAP